MLTIYRAVQNPSSATIKRRATRRPPGNIPYVVDNLLEWLRPEDFPSRRTAVCCAPTPEEALRCAGGKGTVYSVHLDEPIEVAQLNVWDAKVHPDIAMLHNAVKSALRDAEWFEWPVDKKQGEAALFVPCLDRAEVQSVISGSKILSRVSVSLREQSSFWKDVSLLDARKDVGSPVGEFFFDGSKVGHRLIPVER